MRTVAGKHRLAAYHNKQCWPAFRGVPTSTTLNPKNKGFSKFFLRYQSVTHISRVNCAEIAVDRHERAPYHNILQF